MKIKQSLFLACLSLGIVACQEPVSTEAEANAEVQVENAQAMEESDNETDNLARVEEIKALQTQIENWSKGQEAYTLSTDSLRPKLKQKWSQIHFYSENGMVKRIKTYPHAAVSDRTEEFYFENGALVLAVVEDHGNAEGEAEVADKMYFYQAGEVIGEENSANEKEYAIKSSDAEELLQEANEYLDLMKK
jgi:hypothetical protein